jgi:hypothetical protein
VDASGQGPQERSEPVLRHSPLISEDSEQSAKLDPRGNSEQFSEPERRGDAEQPSEPERRGDAEQPSEPERRGDPEQPSEPEPGGDPEPSEPEQQQYSRQAGAQQDSGQQSQAHLATQSPSEEATFSIFSVFRAQPPTFEQLINYSIPRTLWQTAKSHHNTPELGMRLFQGWTRFNPAWDHLIFDDKEVLQFVRNHYNDTVALAFQNMPVGVMKADTFRCGTCSRGAVASSAWVSPRLLCH